jgi:hypothetical protein
MLRLMRTAVVNMLTGPIITDLLLHLQEHLTRESHPHLGNAMNGGLLTYLMHQATVMTILIPMIPTLVATGTIMTPQNQEIPTVGVESGRQMMHLTRVQIEHGHSVMAVVILHHHTRNLPLGRLLLPMKSEVQAVITGLQRTVEVGHPMNGDQI